MRYVHTVTITMLFMLGLVVPALAAPYDQGEVSIISDYSSPGYDDGGTYIDLYNFSVGPIQLCGGGSTGKWFLSTDHPRYTEYMVMLSDALASAHEVQLSNKDGVAECLNNRHEVLSMKGIRY